MKLTAKFKLASIAVAACLIETQAYADVLPGAAMPEQVSRSLKQQQIQQQPTGVAPTLKNEDEKEAVPLSPEVQKLKFKLIKIKLEGNKKFSSKEIEKIYASSLGKTITVAELFTIVQNITNFYRNNGYIISRAILPPQHVKSGTVTVQIIEGYLDKVDVTGKPNGARCIVKDYGQNIAKAKPLDIARMEKYLTLANEIPGTQVKAVLTPSKKKTGAADLLLDTTNKIFTGYVSYDNYGTLYIGPQQWTANLGLNSAINSGDATNITFVKTPKGGELGYWDINYLGALNAEGTKYVLGGTRVHTHPLFVLRSSQIDGLNDNYYSNLIVPVIRTRSQTLNYTVGFNYLDSNTTILDQELYQDHLRNLDLGFNYSFADRWLGANSIAANFRQGLPILGYSSNYNPDTATTSRPGGRGDYTKMGFQASRLQALFSRTNLMGSIRGQWAFNPLLSSEQFTFGGSSIGRGYDPAELIGDRGVAGSLELRYDWAIDKFYIQNLQFYTFYDAGEIWNLKTASGTPFNLSATSTGIGVRFAMTRSISGNVMWTQVLTKSIAAEDFIHQGRRPRVFFSVVAALD